MILLVQFQHMCLNSVKLILWLWLGIASIVLNTLIVPKIQRVMCWSVGTQTSSLLETESVRLLRMLSVEVLLNHRLHVRFIHKYNKY